MNNESDMSYSDNSTSRSRISSESESERNEQIINLNIGFSCPLCEVQCDTVHELNDHKRSHVEDSYANKAKSPPRSYFSASQPSSSSYEQYTFRTSTKKRGASVSPNSGNMQKQRPTWKKISVNNVDYHL